MKRYRIFGFADFDARPRQLAESILEEWEEDVKQWHRANKERIAQSLIREFGEINADVKRQNYIDLGNKPFSVLAFHNTFFGQIRSAFIAGSYYPALTGACALGERILNHMVLTLRSDFEHVEFSNPKHRKKIHHKDSCDDWEVSILALEKWGVLLPSVATDYRKLMDKRHKALHFNPETDTNDRQLALEAIHCLQSIISEQFSSFGVQPWFIPGIRGESYIKKEWESRPFIRKIYLTSKNSAFVSYKHRLEFQPTGIVIHDVNDPCLGPDDCDEEFARLREGWEPPTEEGEG